jgi:hypothetical protein
LWVAFYRLDFIIYSFLFCLFFLVFFRISIFYFPSFSVFSFFLFSLVIVCLGAPAASTLIHKNFKIMQERGLWFSNRYAPAVIAALHPAYILRQTGDAYERAYRSLVDDLTAARERARELRRLQEQMQPLKPEGDDQLRLF